MLRQDRLVESIERAGELRVELEQGTALSREIKDFIKAARKPRLLLVAAPHIAQLWGDRLQDAAEWQNAVSLPDMANCLSTTDFDFVLLDMWVGSVPQTTGAPLSRTLLAVRGETTAKTIS